ncbi:MAG: TetR/AcrR family transcriptional regulator [Firmicutes bacterium]|nr:TetR/AcrR family transcriptional regulator [Bacillota bacterium]
MRVTKDPQIRKQEILETAMTLFEQNGIGKTSMSDIAKEANVTKGLVYYYFSSKDELVEAVVALFVRDTNQRLQQIVEGSSLTFYEKLLQIMTLYFVTIQEHLKFVEASPANAGIYELIKNSLSESALVQTKDFIKQATEEGILTIDYPEYTLKILINGIADLYLEGVHNPKIFATLIEQTLALPKGSLQLK